MRYFSYEQERADLLIMNKKKKEIVEKFGGQLQRSQLPVSKNNFPGRMDGMVG
jgi:hypothetical protein